MIHPVILCGGSGTRLWPLSRKSYPKQFSRLTGKTSLFQQSILRHTCKHFAPPLILTHESFRFIVREQLAEIGVIPAAILLEPEARNTAPAILTAALWLSHNSVNTTMLVAPSDHLIGNNSAYLEAIQAGQTAMANQLIIFGAKPTRPETGYGYMKLAPESVPVRSVEAFIEKPAMASAEKMFRDGDHLWNCGIFLFNADALISAYASHVPAMRPVCQEALNLAHPDLNFLRLALEPWSNLDNISFDYAILENAKNIAAIPMTSKWSDLGDWHSVWRENQKDENGIAHSGSVTVIDCHNSLLRAEDDNQELVGIGLKNIVAIAMPDAVLIADISDAQNVKIAVEKLKERNSVQAEQFPQQHRPWGWIESLSHGQNFKVKRLTIHPGAAISLQSHQHRAEHWIIVAGTAQITIGQTTRLVSENQSVYVPAGEKHRLQNPGKMDLQLIEVQTGDKVTEEDIIRHEDMYNRGSAK